MARIDYFIDSLARRIPPVPSGRKTSVPGGYEDDPVDSMAAGLGVAEGQSFIIEYVNAAGKSSMRRITVFSIVAGAGGVPCLMARCHERKATRQFRADRIAACIDYDGEVFEDVAGFLSDTFGMDLRVASRQKGSEREKHWQQIVACVRPMAVLLAAVSRSDGQVRSVEIETSAQCLAKIAERKELWVEQEDFERLVTYIRRLRPDAQAIGRALDEVSRYPKADVVAFFQAAKAVMEADGVAHPEEAEIINEMAREILGADVFS